MKAAVLTSYRQFEWTEVPTPSCGDNQVLIKVSHAGICGSDLHVYQGEFHPRTPVPFIPGHEFAGTVAQTGKKVSGLNPGDLVVADPIVWCGHCAACQLEHYPACTSLKLVGIDFDGGFAEYVRVEVGQVYKIPAGIDPRHAALIEVLAIGFHACGRAGLRPGDSLAIWGGGRVGQCILQAARTMTDAPIYLVDIDDARLQKAVENYRDVIPVNAMQKNAAKVIQEKTEQWGVDIAFEAVGHALGVEQTGEPVLGCNACLRPAGTICVLGLSDQAVPVVFKDLIWKEAKLVTSRVSHGEFANVIKALQAGALQPEALISDVIPAAQTQTAFESILKNPQAHLKVLLDFTTGG
ncbi:zinc-binding dehydrogenase [Planctomycetota bacterium]